MKIIVITFIIVYFLFCYNYCVSFVKKELETKNSVVQFSVLILFIPLCIIITPISIGKNLGSFFYVLAKNNES